jgi:hypothetical protein
MTIYKGLIRGESKPRYVKAKNKGEAQNHFVTLSALSADQVEELIGGDAKIERAGEAIAAPAPEGGTGEQQDAGAE